MTETFSDVKLTVPETHTHIDMSERQKGRERER